MDPKIGLREFFSGTLCADSGIGLVKRLAFRRLAVNLVCWSNDRAHIQEIVAGRYFHAGSKRVTDFEL